MAKAKADVTGPARSKEQREAFETMIARAPPELQPLAKQARKLVMSVMPGCIEIVWPAQGIASWGTGPKKMSQHFCYVSFSKAHMGFGFYYGAGLPDPAGLLEGTGKNMRHTKIATKAELKRPELRKLVELASTHRVPPLSASDKQG